MNLHAIPLHRRTFDLAVYPLQEALSLASTSHKTELRVLRTGRASKVFTAHLQPLFASTDSRNKCGGEPGSSA